MDEMRKLGRDEVCVTTSNLHDLFDLLGLMSEDTCQKRGEHILVYRPDGEGIGIELDGNGFGRLYASAKLLEERKVKNGCLLSRPIARPED